MNIMVNDVIVYAESGQKDRVLWISENGIALIDIEDKKAMPRIEPRSAIEELISTNDAATIQFQTQICVSEDSITDSARRIRDERWHAIEELVSSEPQIYISEERGKLVRKALSKNGMTKPTLYLSLRRYWQRGKVRNALLPDFEKCGAKGVTRKPGEQKRGRPKKYGGAEGINIDETHQRIILVALKRFYLNDSELSLKQAYNSMIRVFYNEGIHEDQSGNETPVISADAEYPTLGQFRYWFEKERDIRHVIESRRGKIAYAKDHRAVLGSSTAEVYGPGSRFQIDATIADIYLVSRLDPTKIVGRPVLYFVVDVFSRMIVGFYVGLEGPSWVTAMMALANAVSNKVEYCKQYGREISEEEWPTHYLPNAIIGDRGEMLCSSLENLINNFGVKVENTSPYRADWKGIVEQHFKIHQSKFKPFAPGYVKPDFQQRGAKDYRLDAALNIDDFTRIIIEIILNHNNYAELDKYDAHEFLVPDDVAPVPIELWNWGIINRSGRLKSHDANVVRLNLLPQDHATITPNGIAFRGCYYSCATATKENWFATARAKGRQKIKVSYDPRSMDTIYLKAGEQQNFESCYLLERSRQFENRSLWEIEAATFLLKEGKEKRSQRRLQATVALDHALDKIKHEAIDRKQPIAFPTSKIKRIGSIRDNRKMERELQRSREVFADKEKSTATQRVVPLLDSSTEQNSSYSSELKMLAENRRKRWRDDEVDDDE